jgi:hypothetical protein
MGDIEYESVHGPVIGTAKIQWRRRPMRHAIEVLEERHSELRALIRRCAEISDRTGCAVGSQDYSGWLMELERAIECLRDAERKLKTGPAMMRGDGPLPERR